MLAPAKPDETVRRNRSWLLAAASTTAALATGFAVSEGFSYKATQSSVRELARSRDLTLDMDARSRARSQGLGAEQRAQLLSRVSDICLAGTVAATGATLLIWLTSRQRREDEVQPRMLLGPMVLRGASGAGLVLREKF